MWVHYISCYCKFPVVYACLSKNMHIILVDYRHSYYNNEQEAQLLLR